METRGAAAGDYPQTEALRVRPTSGAQNSETAPPPGGTGAQSLRPESCPRLTSLVPSTKRSTQNVGHRRDLCPGQHWEINLEPNKTPVSLRRQVSEKENAPILPFSPRAILYTAMRSQQSPPHYPPPKPFTRRPPLPAYGRSCVVGRYGEGAIASVSFDKGFTREAERQLLELYVPVVVMPKRGKKNAVETERESDKKFVRLRQAHSGVESAIASLEHHGLNRLFGRGLGRLSTLRGLRGAGLQSACHRAGVAPAAAGSGRCARQRSLKLRHCHRMQTIARERCRQQRRQKAQSPQKSRAARSDPVK